MDKLTALKAIRVGERVAEEEIESLENYFVETNQWNEIFQGEKDLVFGPKGAGKSALYALVNKRSDKLEKRGVIVSLAENPIGATVFENLEIDPPPSEIAFVLLWKVYILTLIADMLRSRGIRSEEADSLISTLNQSGLLPRIATRETLFASVRRLIANLFDKNVKSIETSVAMDPVTGLPVLTGKLELQSNPDQRVETMPVDGLLTVANVALEKSGLHAWLLFDRLDVAFSENPDLERNALRALFRAYRDLRRFNRVVLKLFIRDDVWDRITDEGFAEASHLIRSTSITWDDASLRNLLVRRLASNAAFLEFVNMTESEIMSSAAKQKAVLESVLPDKVEIGKNPSTFDWMLSRIADGSKKPTPRELIHMLDEARRIQIERFERAESSPPGGQLFDRAVFKQALKRVSDVRYQQTFRAENPSVVKFTDAMRGKKAEQTLESLAALWETDPDETKELALKLESLGFFEKRSSSGQMTFWVPFVYRDALQLVQGRADI